MKLGRTRALALIAFAVAVLRPTAASADEGMWLFNNPPKKILKEKYGFDATPEWLEHVQKASVRFPNGSGSFISADGLIITNHHIGNSTLQKLSTKDRDYIKTGFRAKSRDQEVKAHDLELNILMNIEDVTKRVNAAVKPGMAPADAQKARRAVTNTIEKESFDKTGLRSDVVTLYNGGQYHLYRYKKYTDVRLVFAPEKDIAFFGGDPDNFEYPRYDLDICFFRAYENGKPAKIEHYLKWSPEGAEEDDLIFVSGNPGRTDRLNTMTHLEFIRDVDMPNRLNLIRRREVLLSTYASRSTENARRAQEELFSYQNSRKARLGMLAGLQDPAIMNKKRADEKALRDAVMNNDKYQEMYGDAWDQVAASLKTYRPIYLPHYLLERGAAFNSELFIIARNLVRLAEEKTKPNPQRLREYTEAALDSLKHQLFSEAPIYDDLETIQLADSLGMLMEMMGANNELVQKILAGKSPQARAAELIQSTKLKDVSVRKKLEAGGQKAIEACEDPVIHLAKLVDGPARQLRRTYEEKVDEPQRQAYAKIANARFAIYGTDIYPDATFTLRLAYGVAKGYEERGDKMPWATTLGGAFKHAAAHNNTDPFALPKSWHDRKDRMNLETPFNFVSTADIIGGNSGSPVINRKGEFVGIIFDGNIQSLVLDYIYTEEQARAISVCSQGIMEVLRNVYDAGGLVEEIMGKGE